MIQQELSAIWFLPYGVIAYAMVASLAAYAFVFSIGKWLSARSFALLLRSLSALCFMLVAFGLALIASEPTWIDRYTLSVFQRSLAGVGALAGWAYVFADMHLAWLCKDEFSSQR